MHVTLCLIIVITSFTTLIVSTMDVLVIGAGAAGMMATRKLFEAGLKVACLEGLDKIGGRIVSESFGDNIVDLGGALCEGYNIIYDLANPLGLLEKPQPKKRHYLWSNGEVISSTAADTFTGRIRRLVDGADLNSNKSVSQYIDEILKPEISNKDDPHLYNAVLEWYKRRFNFFGTSDPKAAKSLRDLAVRHQGEGPWLGWKDRGMTTLFDIILNKYPDPSKALPLDIKLNKDVVRIEWQTPNKLVKVTCKDGTIYEAKTVISTVSLGVLKNRLDHLFVPQLPETKMKTINSLQTYYLDKIYIEFTKPWWDGPTNYNIIWNENDKSNFEAQEKWITEIFTLSTVDYQNNVLVAWINDDGAKQMEYDSDENVRKGIQKLLDMVFKNHSVTPIKNVLRTKWGKNKCQLGANSYHSVLTEELGGTAEILSEPLLTDEGFPIVCFAGEATSYNHHASVHGALETGIREANRIINALQKNE